MITLKEPLSNFEVNDTVTSWKSVVETRESYKNEYLLDHNGYYILKCKFMDLVKSGLSNATWTHIEDWVKRYNKVPGFKLGIIEADTHHLKFQMSYRAPATEWTYTIPFIVTEETIEESYPDSLDRCLMAYSTELFKEFLEHNLK